MNAKPIFAAAIVIMAVFVIIEMPAEAEQSDADSYYDVYVTAPVGLLVDLSYWDGTGYSEAYVSPTTTYSVRVPYGGSVFMTAVVFTGGYDFDYWTINGTVDSNKHTSAGIASGSSDTTLTIILYSQQVTPSTVTLTVSGADGGQVEAYRYPGQNAAYATYSSSSTFDVTPGETIYFRIVDTYTGCGFVRWNKDGSSWTTSQSFGVSTTSSNITISAVFTADTYTVSISADSNGSVDTNTISSVPYRSTITVSGATLTINGTTVTASPDSGYTFLSWSVSNGDTVTGDMTITASFTAAVVQIRVVNMAGGTVTITSDVDSTITISSNTVYTGYLTLYSNITVTATALSDFTFQDFLLNNTTTVTTNPMTISNLTGHTEIIVDWTATTTYLIEITAGSGGSVSLSNLYVTPNATITTSSNALFVDGYNVYAYPDSGYSFRAWSVTTGTVVTSDMAITASFITDSDYVYWSNGMYNGVITMVFQYESSQNYAHTMDMQLLSGTTSSNVTTWSDSGYDLEITTSYPALYVTVTLSYNGTTVDTNTIRTGMWATFQLTIDTASGSVIVTPVNSFTSFIQYTVYESQARTVLDWSDTVTGLTVYEIAHYDDDSSGSNAVRFSVYSTQVFLDTYGVVLTDPTINVYDYFPQYESVRLNLYSFALYGDSITINGTTWTLDGSDVTIAYVKTSTGNYLPSAYPNSDTSTKTLELSNIYITWDGDTGHCSLTFVSDRFTIDLGTYATGSETISFSGLWYFTTALYEPYEKTELSFGDWQYLPNISVDQFILIFLGILLVTGVAAHIKFNSGIIDLVIIGVAALVAFLALGL